MWVWVWVHVYAQSCGTEMEKSGAHAHCKEPTAHSVHKHEKKQARLLEGSTTLNTYNETRACIELLF